MKTIYLTCLGVLLAWIGLPAAEPQTPADLRLESRPSRGEIEVLWGKQRLLLYVFATNQFKPYVKELYTLRGANVLRDAPADHLHHHALMYAITVNGVNFWEEHKAPGFQRSAAEPVGSLRRNAAGRPQAVIGHLLHWVAQTNAGRADTASVALLIERRRLTLTVDAAREEVALEWRSDFEVGPAAPQVRLTGTDYHGLGLRFPVSFDRVAVHGNSDQQPYPTQGKRDVLEAAWASVTAPIDGRPLTLAVFHRPGQNRGPARFFSMLHPFTYLSATQGLDQAPLDYAAGEKFTVRHLVTVYPEPRTHEFLQQRHEAWMRDHPAP